MDEIQNKIKIQKVRIKIFPNEIKTNMPKFQNNNNINVEKVKLGIGFHMESNALIWISSLPFVA